MTLGGDDVAAESRPTYRDGATGEQRPIPSFEELLAADPRAQAILAECSRGPAEPAPAPGLERAFLLGQIDDVPQHDPRTLGLARVFLLDLFADGRERSESHLAHEVGAPKLSPWRRTPFARAVGLPPSRTFQPSREQAHTDPMLLAAWYQGMTEEQVIAMLAAWVAEMRAEMTQRAEQTPAWREVLWRSLAKHWSLRQWSVHDPVAVELRRGADR